VYIVFTVLLFGSTKVAFDLNTTPITGIGLMCGTSHDALDIAGVEFEMNSGVWSYRLLASRTIPLRGNLLKDLDRSTSMSGLELATLDFQFASFCAESVNVFIAEEDAKYDFIASHGVTIFHDPDNGINMQIGSGAIISSLTRLTVVCDFRSQDVALSGQGAPLVPLADALLFSEFEYTLNLGGFANLAKNSASNVTGFDVSFCNLALNFVSRQLGKPFDMNGDIARSGQLITSLFEALNNLDYYNESPPKSLGIEWMTKHLDPLLNDHSRSPKDLLFTLTEHIATQIGIVLPVHGRCLITGGGAHNTYLIERIKQLTRCDVSIPDGALIDYKEAVDFAFLGVLRLQEKTNVLSSVTGAKSDTISGAVYIG